MVILKIAFVYVATILGAGFATGKELVNFFAKFNNIGILGFTISCILLGLCCISILDTIYKINVFTYKQFIYTIFGKFGKYIEWFNICFLFILFSTMLAGGGETISNVFNINIILSNILFCTIIFISFIFGKKCIINLNTILCPLLIIGCILIGIYLCFETTPVFNNNINALISPIIYTSYNSITTISVLFTIKDSIINRKIAIYSGILSGIFIFLIGLFMLIPLIKNYDIIYNSALPILNLIKNENIFKNIYSFTILIAIFTTAVSNGITLENTFKEKYNLNGTIIKIGIIILGILFSLMGFSNIVSFIYPIFGIIGIFEILVIIIIFLTNASIDK